MKPLAFALGAGFVVAWLHTAPAAATVASGASVQNPQFRASTDLVEVYVTATSKNGAGVHDLRGDEFELYEDGKRREISVFSTMVQPLSVALVLDHSGSTDSEFTQVLQATGEFIGRLFKEDRASLSTLGWDCVPFTSDRAVLVEKLGQKLPRDPGSPIWSAADRAMAALVPETGRRVILLLSDGADNQQAILDQPRVAKQPPKLTEPGPCAWADTMTTLQTLRDVMDRAERETVMVYAVAVPSSDPSGGGVAFGAASSGGDWTSGSATPPPVERNPRADLVKLAKRSGGSVHELNDYAQLKAAFKMIADELHLQYLLGFVPTNFDGKRHEITIRVKRPGVVVRARESYRAKTK
jgi:VWFA-related protein